MMKFIKYMIDVDWFIDPIASNFVFQLTVQNYSVFDEGNSLNFFYMNA